MKLASFIDHTLLKADASETDIRKHCQDARQYGFYSVCLNSQWIALAKVELQGSNVKLCSVVGFPLGAMLTNAKAYETETAIEQGADEIDMVVALGYIKSNMWNDARDDIQEVVRAAQGRRVKVILETASLTHDEKKRACEITVQAGAHFVKTSTGFGGGGATEEDVKLMRSIVGPEFGVKASGGIRTREQALKMIEAGANRLGTSASVSFFTGENATSSY